MKKLIILGAGGYGQEVYDIVSQLKIYEKIEYLDDNSPLATGKCESWTDYIKDWDIYPAFGNNKTRLDFVNKIISANGSLATIVHPSAYVSPTVKIGVGTVILPNSIVNTDTVIGNGCIINCGAIVDHGCVIENGVHICLGAIVKAENQIPAFTKIEAGQIIENRTYPIRKGE